MLNAVEVLMYHSIKWVTPKVATRLTKEVDLVCEISSDGRSISLRGTGDCEHHLVEDCAILLKKMAEIKCGPGH